MTRKSVVVQTVHVVGGVLRVLREVLLLLRMIWF